MTAPTGSAAASPTFIQWIVDTRPLWPVAKRANPREEVAGLKDVVCILIHSLQ